ncbi:MFS transporter [Actinoallomurus liliacearum]|uniref:MFS transporter n=1 Tax=Actinoallomurus liliacearum TaxID=1080073 RepID=A0ABP8TJ73_9ACTN
MSGKALAVLRERDFRRFFIGQSASLLGDGMVGVALAFAVLDLTGSPADLGYVLAARTIPMIAGLPAGGVLADRLPRRWIMVAADLARFVGQGTMAALLVGGHAAIWELAACQAVHGMSAALFSPASTGLVPAIVPGEHLQQANALRGLALSIGRIGGPVLSGLLVATVGPGWAIAADAATFAISAIMLARLRLPAHRPAPAQSFVRDLREGWTEFSSRTWVWTLVAAASLTNLLFAAFYVLGPAATALASGGPATWAAIQAVLGVGALIGGLIALRLHPRRPLRTGVSALALSSLSTLGLAAHLPVVPMAGLALLGGIGMTLFNTFMETSIQHHVPAKALSRVSAYDWFGSYACQPIGQATAGPLGAGLGIHPALWLAGTLQFLVALATLAVPAIRRLPAGAGNMPTPAHSEA